MVFHFLHILVYNVQKKVNSVYIEQLLFIFVGFDYRLIPRGHIW